MIDYGPDPLGVLTRTEYAEFLQGGGEQQYRVPGGVVQSAATGGELVRGVDPNGGEVHFHSAGSGSITAVGGVRLAEVARVTHRGSVLDRIPIEHRSTETSWPFVSGTILQWHKVARVRPRSRSSSRARTSSRPGVHRSSCSVIPSRTPTTAA